MSRLFSETWICYLMLRFTYIMNLWNFSSEGLNCRAMTEQKTSLVTLVSQCPSLSVCDVTLFSPLSPLSLSPLQNLFLTL